MSFETLSAESLELLCEELADLRHDLGKYITFEARFIGLDADTEALRQALRADILQTYKRGDHIESAWQLWERLRPAALSRDDPDVLRIEAALGALKQLSIDDAERDALLSGAAQASAVAEACRALLSRARVRLSQLEEEG